jgi:predicted RNA methylase
LRQSIVLNHLTDVVTVVPGDVMSAPLPSGVDVFIGELIETGLMDEMQVPVSNALRARGIIGPYTRMIPESYTTWVDLVRVDSDDYGFRIAAPRHEWPFYAQANAGWNPAAVRALTTKAAISTVDFRRHVESRVETRVTVTGLEDGLANGLRLSGLIRLAPDVILGPTNALNGDKILHLADEVRIDAGEEIGLDLRYSLGEGLLSFECRVPVR